MPDSRPGFQQLQYRFAAYLRDPEQQPAPEGIESRRLRIYADLFYKNMHGYLSNGFPVLCSLYAEEDWHGLVRGFYARHESHSPQFYQIGEEFLTYLKDEHTTRECDPPFLWELAHYEWVEMALAIDPTEPDLSRIDTDGDLLAGRPVMTPWLHNLSYQYDVHRISEQYQPASAPQQATFLAVYRRLDDQISFLELNAMSARLLSGLVAEPGRTGHEQLMTLARHSGQDAQTLLDYGADLLDQLRDRQLILGSRSPDSH